MSTAAVAAAAMAALTASQAPGLNLVQPSAEDDGGRSDQPRDNSPGDGSYHTELPPLESPQPPGEGPGGDTPPDLPDESGIPSTVLAAYKRAESALATSDPGCRLPWQLLAAIGKVESGQARGGAVDEEGTTLEPILGPVLNGAGFALIEDTDGGVYDGNTRFDRAVGPMQFIPSTWAKWGADGNGDGRQDPNNIYDAALAAGRYLCAGERDLSVQAELERAILSYNHSNDYLRTVLAWYEFYRNGVHEIPDGSGVLPTSPGPVGNGDQGDGDSSGGGDGNRSPKPEDPAGGGRDEEEPATEEPEEDPTQPPDDGQTPTPSPEQVALEEVGDSEVTAPVGGEFPEGFRVRATTSEGEPAADVRVRYTVEGETDARFVEGAREVVVITGEDGIATAPTLRAGERAGEFTVLATLEGVGGQGPAAKFTATVDQVALEEVGDSEVTAPVGGEFPEGFRVRATTSEGEPAADVRVRYTVEGETDARFVEGAREVVVITGEDGIATAPTLRAGERAGEFTVLATLEGVGEQGPAAKFTATVEPASSPEPAGKADKLALLTEPELTAEVGGVFAGPIRVRAVYQGERAPSTVVEATLLTGEGEPLPTAEGPYFENGDGEPTHTLRDLETNAQGTLNLPKVHTGQQSNTYQLLLTTADGGRRVVKLEVVKPAGGQGSQDPASAQ